MEGALQGAAKAAVAQLATPERPTASGGAVLDRTITAIAARLSPVPCALGAALLHLQAAAWALTPTLTALSAAAGPLDPLTPCDVQVALAFLLASGPVPLRLLLPGTAGAAEPSDCQ